MSDQQLDAISTQVQPVADAASPPLQLWHPALNGDIDIVIDRDGNWIHEGRAIERLPLVKLFASILRREDDGEYYLVTPVEKWRLRVEWLPLTVTDFEILEQEGTGEQLIQVVTNTERHYCVGQDYPLYLPDLPGLDGIPAIQLDHGVAALFTRAAWYRLAELCEDTAAGMGVRSRGKFFALG